jgi:hypothetical protein
MGVGFIRRYGFDPGVEELAKIEGVAVIDREPPQIVTGIGTGTVCVVGEFENGPFAFDETPGASQGPVEVFGSGDVLSRFGDLGYEYAGVPSNNPCARSRLADGAVVPEYWNGNGAVALARKAFRRLLLARVDTSVGEVTFTRLASIVGGDDFTFDLEPAQALVFDVGAGNVTATFTAAAATLNSAAGTYPSTFAGGESITFALDGTEYTAVFLAADQTQAQVIARMNLAAGYAAFVDEGGAVTSINGRIRGTDGSVQVVAVSALIVTTATGFAAGAAVPGTGNVADIDAVTVAEANAIVNAADPDTFVDRTSSGNARIYTAQPTIVLDATTDADAFGFAEGVTADAEVGTAGSIPAGTRVSTGAIDFVTMRDLAVAADSSGPYAVKVRHALDDGTGLGAGVATVDVVGDSTGAFPIALGAFSVTNLLPISAALSEAAIDARYVQAVGKTKSVRNVGKEITIIASARQSNVVRNELRSNALDASANGCFGRVATIRPPLGTTTRALALSTTSQPGAVAYRSDRVVYNFPGARVNVPRIAARGLDGGAGFTADGNLDVGSDVWCASLMSQLPPEENIGQATSFLTGILDIEAGNPDVQDLQMADYVAFKAGGICALRIDGGEAFFQTEAADVDPALYPALRTIKRRRMSDFIQDSLAIAVLPFVKKLATVQRRALVVSVVDTFLRSLLSPDNPDNQRIAGYRVTNASTADELKRGIFRIKIKVKLLPSLDVIVLDTTIGETVEFEEAA